MKKGDFHLFILQLATLNSRYVMQLKPARSASVASDPATSCAGRSPELRASLPAQTSFLAMAAMGRSNHSALQVKIHSNSWKLMILMTKLWKVPNLMIRNVIFRKIAIYWGSPPCFRHFAAEAAAITSAGHLAGPDIASFWQGKLGVSQGFWGVT